MGPITRGAIITFAFAVALIVPALAGLARAPTVASQDLNACWKLVTQTNAGVMLPICSSNMY
jgi:hypothetical protein